VSRGLMRLVLADEVSPREVAESELLELTRTGLEVLAAHLGLCLGVAVRHHGLAAGGRADRPRVAAALSLGRDRVFESQTLVAAGPVHRRRLQQHHLAQRTPARREPLHRAEHAKQRIRLHSSSVRVYVAVLEGSNW
jgi:hypothetical protein